MSVSKTDIKVKPLSINNIKAAPLSDDLPLRRSYIFRSITSIRFRNSEYAIIYAITNAVLTTACLV